MALYDAVWKTYAKTRRNDPRTAEKLLEILASSPLEPLKTYDLPTPYDSFGSGAVLMEALQQSKLTHS
jgi:hypothetical protein